MFVSVLQTRPEKANDREREEVLFASSSPQLEHTKHTHTRPKLNRPNIRTAEPIAPASATTFDHL